METERDPLQEPRAPTGRLGALVDALADGLVLIDIRGTVLVFDSTAAKLFGWSAEEILGRNVSILMPERWCSEHDGYLARYVPTGVHMIDRERIVVGLHRDGMSFPLGLKVTEAGSGDGRIFVALVFDAVRRRAAQGELERLERQVEAAPSGWSRRSRARSRR